MAPHRFSRNTQHAQVDRGLTLPEVLILLGVLALLLQFLLPSLLALRDSSRRNQCESHLKEIGRALAESEATHAAMPQAAGYYPGGAPKEEAGKPPTLPSTPPAILGSIHYFLLPFLGEQELYMCWRGSTQYEVFLNHNPNGIPPAFYLCPSDMTSAKPGIVTLPGGELRLGVTNYAANIQSLGHWFDGKSDPHFSVQPNFDVKPRSSDMSDGVSQTIAFAERYQICRDSGAARPGWLGTMPSHFDPVFSWNTSADTPLIRQPQIAPTDEVCDPDATQSAHPGGMNVLMFDGGVQRIGSSIDESVWNSLVMPRDGAESSADANL